MAFTMRDVHLLNVADKQLREEDGSSEALSWAEKLEETETSSA